MKKQKLYTCKNCKSKFEKKNSTQIVCSYQCAIELAKKQKEKKEGKEWRERKKGLAIELGIKQKPHQEPLQKAINTIARMIDKDLPCIARPFENTQSFDAGHVWSVGSHPALRYNLWNIYKQGVKSNRDKGGEQLLMLEGIEIRHGREKRLEVEEMPLKCKYLGLTIEEKKEALKKANQIIREIKEGKEYDRDLVNEVLGIYK